MEYQTAKWFWNDCLRAMSLGGGDDTRKNVACIFVKNAKDGQYDNLSDEEFEQKEEDAKDINLFWDQKIEAKVSEIFANAMRRTDIPEAMLETFADMLASASADTQYRYEPPSVENPWGTAGSGSMDFAPFETEEEPCFSIYQTPHQIYDTLCGSVYGQEEAKKAASMLVYNHLKGHRRNLVMAGPTASGKTEIWRALQKEFCFITIVNGPQIAADGWKGSFHIRDIFFPYPAKEAGRLIIVVDEADKMFEPAIGGGGTDYAAMLQNEWLKIMDGDTITFIDEKNSDKSITVDCSGVSVVLCGSFERMLREKGAASKHIGFGTLPGGESGDAGYAECTEEDLVQYANVRREIAGRINQIVTLKGLEAADFEAILKGRMSPVRKLEEDYQVSLKVSPVFTRRLAEEAAESGLGCRYMRSRLQKMLDGQMFDDPDREEYCLHAPGEDSPELDSAA